MDISIIDTNGRFDYQVAHAKLELSIDGIRVNVKDLAETEEEKYELWYVACGLYGESGFSHYIYEMAEEAGFTCETEWLASLPKEDQDEHWADFQNLIMDCQMTAIDGGTGMPRLWHKIMVVVGVQKCVQLIDALCPPAAECLHGDVPQPEFKRFMEVLSKFMKANNVHVDDLIQETPGFMDQYLV